MNSEKRPLPDILGPPDIKLGGLQIWVHSREHTSSPASISDWLTVTAHCGGSGADIWTRGSILMLSEISDWCRDCETIYRTYSGRATLGGIEPELFATIEVPDRLGHIRVRVEITPDYLRQQHKFEFELDQSYLPDVIRDCKKLLSRLGPKADTL